MDAAEGLALVGAATAALIANNAQTTANQALGLAQQAPNMADAAESAAVAAAAVQSAADANAALVSSTLLILGGTGVAAPGPVALVGANVGANVRGVVAVAGGNIVVLNADFEGVISVQDQIQQTAGAHAAQGLAVILQGP